MKAATALAALAAAGILLALGGPGVTVARAEGARRVPLEIGGDAASCRAHGADDAARVAATRTSEAMARLQEQMRQELEAGGGDVVVLNGRGYNYGRDQRPDPAHELQILRREAERQRARQAE